MIIQFLPRSLMYHATLNIWQYLQIFALDELHVYNKMTVGRNGNIWISVNNAFQKVIWSREIQGYLLGWETFTAISHGDALKSSVLEKH